MEKYTNPITNKLNAINAKQSNLSSTINTPISVEYVKEEPKHPIVFTYNSPTLEQKEESMDALTNVTEKPEDTSGNTESNVTNFLEKYADGNDIIQVLRKDLMSILSDVQWIQESQNQHEQWALDFADALNELSVKI